MATWFPYAKANKTPISWSGFEVFRWHCCCCCYYWRRRRRRWWCLLFICYMYFLRYMHIAHVFNLIGDRHTNLAQHELKRRWIKSEKNQSLYRKSAEVTWRCTKHAYTHARMHAQIKYKIPHLGQKNKHTRTLHVRCARPIQKAMAAIQWITS